MIKVYHTKEEVWCNLQEMRRSLVELAVVVSWGQSLARGCIHIGINTNAPGAGGPFAHYQQVLCSDDDCPEDTPLVGSRCISVIQGMLTVMSRVQESGMNWSKTCGGLLTVVSIGLQIN